MFDLRMCTHIRETSTMAQYMADDWDIIQTEEIPTIFFFFFSLSVSLSLQKWNQKPLHSDWIVYEFIKSEMKLTISQ